MDDFVIEFMTEDDLPVVADMFSTIFDDIYQGEIPSLRFAFMSNLPTLINHEISLVMRHKDRIIAAYGLREESLTFDVRMCDPAFNEPGLKGVVLAIEPEYRNVGIGSRFVEESKKVARDLGRHYVFGSHDKRLRNIGFWKKHREVVEEAEDHYVTMKVLYNDPESIG